MMKIKRTRLPKLDLKVLLTKEFMIFRLKSNGDKLEISFDLGLKKDGFSKDEFMDKMAEDLGELFLDCDCSLKKMNKELESIRVRDFIRECEDITQKSR